MQVFLFLFFVILNVSAFAQDAKEAPNLLDALEESNEQVLPRDGTAVPRGSLPDERKRALPYDNYDEIPEEAILEAEAFYDSCSASYHKAAHYDCACLSMRFLEARIERGPIASASLVELDIRGECPNIVGAAGLAYTNCINQQPGMFPRRQDPEEFCSCVGNAYGKLYAREGHYPDSRTMTRLRTTAALSCTKQPPGIPPLVPPVK